MIKYGKREIIEDYLDRLEMYRYYIDKDETELARQYQHIMQNLDAKF